MYHNLREVYLWEDLKKDITKFVVKCENSKQVKSKHQKLDGFLKEIKVPTWNWKDINMEFVVGLHRNKRKYDSILVVVISMTKSFHFIPVNSTYSTENYARIIIDEIVYRHSILLSIISHRGTQFTSRFWRSF